MGDVGAVLLDEYERLSLDRPRLWSNMTVVVCNGGESEGAVRGDKGVTSTMRVAWPLGPGDGEEFVDRVACELAHHRKWGRG